MFSNTPTKKQKINVKHFTLQLMLTTYEMLRDSLIHIMSYNFQITWNFINQSITFHSLGLLEISLNTLKIDIFITQNSCLYIYINLFIYLVGGSEHTLFHQLAHSWHSPSISCNNINYQYQETIMCLHKIYYNIKRKLQIW